TCDSRELSGKRLELGDSARRFGRKELEPIEPEIEPAHDVACGCYPRQISCARALRGLRERLRQAWGNEELRAGLDRLIELPPVQYGARADDRAGDTRHPANGVERDRRPQRDFEHWKACCYEGLSQLRPILIGLENEHRDDRRAPHDFVDRHPCSFAKAAAAPIKPGCGWVMSLTGISSIRRSKRPLAMKRS